MLTAQLNEITANEGFSMHVLQNTNIPHHHFEALDIF